MFEVTVRGETPAALKTNLAAVLAHLGGPAAGKTTNAAVEQDEAPPPRARPKAAAEEPAELDYATDVKPHVVALSKDINREVALEVLGKFTNAATDEPCTKGTEVSPEDWPKLLKEIKKARAKHEVE